LSFLPNILLSGFAFHLRTCRIVRGIVLQGANVIDLRHQALALTVLTFVAMAIATAYFKRTFD
jgi:hypothetical protein